MEQIPQFPRVPSTFSSDAKKVFPKNSSAQQKVMQEVMEQQARPVSEHTSSSLITEETSSDATQKVQEAVHFHLPQGSPQQRPFENLTRNIPHCEEMLARHGRDEEVLQLSSQVHQGNMEQVIERYKQIEPATLAWDALKALHQNKIGIEQFCTLAYLYTLLDEFPGQEISVQPLFDANGNVDETARTAFAEGLYDPRYKNFFNLNEAQELLHTFFEEMQRKAASEQSFFYIPAPGSRGERTMAIALSESVGLRVFNRCTFEGGFFSRIPSLFRMAPSFSMMQALVDVYGKSNTVALSPRIGVSTRADFRRNADRAEREMFVPFPGFPPPSIADGISIADALEFILHDLFHGLLCSQIPHHLRKETGQIADIVAWLQERLEKHPDPMVAALLETFYGRLVDMEFSIFRCKEGVGKATKEEFFLMTLELQLFRNTPERMQQKLSALPSQESRTALSPSAYASLQKWDQIKQAIVEQETMNSVFLSLLSNRSPQSPAPEEVFNDLFNESCEISGVLKDLAHAIDKTGCLHRLHITKENLVNAKKYFNITGANHERQAKGYTASLLEELISIYDRQQDR